MQTSELPEAKVDFRRACRARGLATRTTNDYCKAIDYLLDWLEGKDDQAVTTGLLQDYIADLQERSVNVHKSRHRNPSARIVSKKYALNNFVALQQFFKWAVAEQLVPKDIWVGMIRPRIPKKPVPIISVEDLTALLQIEKPRRSEDAFYYYRDIAMLRFFIDTGVRVAEITTLRSELVDFNADLATVKGKGSKVRQVPFGDKTAQSMRRYLKHRDKRTFSELPEFFIGRQGRLTTQGVREMIQRRCKEAGVPHIHPHQFRHTAAHTWLAEDLGETNLVRLMGWESRQMLQVYATSAATERAIAQHRRAALGDRF